MAEVEVSEFSGIEPLYGPPEEDAVVPIAYSAEFRETFGRLRRVLGTGEESERALALTAAAARLNPANYTVWQLRRRLLKALGSDLRKELAFVSEVIEDNPKNYQIWHHRRTVCEGLGDGSQELPFTARVLRNDDAKNYHAWQHRQWAVEAFGLWDGELDWAAQLLQDDLRNNSVWNYRYFLLSHAGEARPSAAQLDFVWAHIAKAPHNEAAWNFLNGLLAEDGPSAHPELLRKAQALGAASPFALAFQLDFHKDLLDKEPGQPDPATLATVNGLVDQLVAKDPIRTNYWNSLRIPN